MAFLRLFKSVKNQQFSYKPRFWDPKKEEAEKQYNLARRGTYNIQLARAHELVERRPRQALALLNDTSLVPFDLREFS